MTEHEKPGDDEPRTIFSPGPGAAAPGAPPAADAGGTGDGLADDQPAWGAPRVSPPPAEAPPEPAPEPAAAQEAAPAPDGMIGADRTFIPRTPRGDGRSIEVGDVLNSIFGVKRFIARGGMGEVFEGINVSSDERVAIKVMLPSLAADPNVQAMFRKEAKTLTRLAHPALVQYRVLAQEPQLGVLYIVTEYIDGTNLSDMLGQIRVSASELRGLALRLANGLKAAHALDAIHRDISPDNVLLEGGKLDQAKIIDFGIAKDLDVTAKTIVGDGFAGKLNYVAPEQLGDFGREVGPWSDVYSLGLVLLAVCQGRDTDMGATLADAVDRRRAGPDLSPVPGDMRPVIAAMLMADPAKRLRSMDAVIEALDRSVGAPPATPSPPPAPLPAAGQPKSASAGRADGGGNQMKLIIGGLAALLVLAVAAWLALGGLGRRDSSSDVAGADGALATTAPAALSAALPGIPCAWIDVADLKPDGADVDVIMRGAARDPASAQGVISRALSDVGISPKLIDFKDVALAPADMCLALDALRPFRDPNAAVLTVDQPKFELAMDPAQGKIVADPMITIDLGSAASEIALFGMKPTGEIDTINGLVSRAALDKLASSYPDVFQRVDNSYRAKLGTDHVGLSGILRVESSAALSAEDTTLLTLKPAERGADWTAKIAAAAKAGNWHIDMVWYRTVDEIPG